MIKLEKSLISGLYKSYQPKVGRKLQCFITLKSAEHFLFSNLPLKRRNVTEFIYFVPSSEERVITFGNLR